MAEGNGIGLPTNMMGIATQTQGVSDRISNQETSASEERISLESFETESRPRLKAVESLEDVYWQYLNFLVLREHFGESGVDGQRVLINLKEEASHIQSSIVSPEEAKLFQNIILQDGPVMGDLIVTNIFDKRSGLAVFVSSVNRAFDINLRALDYNWYRIKMARFRSKIKHIKNVEAAVLPLYNEKLTEIEERARHKRILEKRSATLKKFTETVNKFKHGQKIKIPVNKTDFDREDSPMSMLFKSYFGNQTGMDGFLRITFLDPKKSNGHVAELKLSNTQGVLVGYHKFDVKNITSMGNVDQLSEILLGLDSINVVTSDQYLLPQKLSQRIDSHIENGIVDIVAKNDVNNAQCDMRLLTRALLEEDYPFSNHITFMEQNPFYAELFNIVKMSYYIGSTDKALPQEEIVFQVIVETMRDSGNALVYLSKIQDLRLKRILTIIYEKLSLPVARYISIEKQYSQLHNQLSAVSSLKNILMIHRDGRKIDLSTFLTTIHEVEVLVGECRAAFNSLNAQSPDSTQIERELRDIARRQLYKELE